MAISCCRLRPSDHRLKTSCPSATVCGEPASRCRTTPTTACWLKVPVCGTPSTVYTASGSLLVNVSVTRLSLMFTVLVVDSPLLSVTVRLISYQVVATLCSLVASETVPLGPTTLST